MSVPWITLGLVLNEARKQLKLSQGEVAAEADVSTAYVTLIEKGRRVPRDGVLERLGAALELDVDELKQQRDLEELLHKVDRVAAEPEVRNLLHEALVARLDSQAESLEGEGASRGVWRDLPLAALRSMIMSARLEPEDTTLEEIRDKVDRLSHDDRVRVLGYVDALSAKAGPGTSPSTPSHGLIKWEPDTPTDHDLEAVTSRTET